MPYYCMIKSTHRAIIDEVTFGLGDGLLERLTSHDVAAATFSNCTQSVKCTTDFLVLSSQRAADLGGQSGVVEAAKAVGAKSVLIVDLNATAYRVEAVLSGRIVIMSLPGGMPESEAIQFIATLLHGTGRALVRSDASKRLYELAARVANSDVSVFINGPTGSGKEIMARFMHDQSPRQEKAFIAINCAAIPDNMLEAMMFGHEKGAFTGASTTNVGVIRAADGGTLLLDEISEMSLQLQAKLLRAIQELTVTPVGGTKSIKVDVRILATSNRDMATECRAGRFRDDLFYRLNVFPIGTQALCDRPEDIKPIAQELIMRHVKNVTEIPMLSNCAVDALQAHSWPGNVRELENVIQRALVLKSSSIITSDSIMIDQLATLNTQSQTLDVPASTARPVL
ncbi:putative transcriptional regulatory protein [Octadecabacter antarcticus 307]|uniref:Nif-specific regulatory protein n=1 Tax=Octadecabacter antarcticus 307 TaxID=391626 RepID=M9R9P5_9RHOB|nr:putative transcriptional regulatory protein [Octadecabacter antarcticus 307]